ncbi:TPA: hypothetical protein EYP45_00500, partial [Candidatus Peregrinibacteria bacterium]|nr:hypothetical protein [Candidatus Peregrinibacteria bacterium]
MEEKGYTDFAYRLRNFSTGALEISGVIGGGLALLIFKKLFLGGATKFFLGGKKRAVVMLGVAWALGTYLIKDGENLSKKEILEKFDVLADLEKKKNEILDIYAHHGFTTGKIIEKISDNFSPENAVKYIDSMFTPESGVKGFFSENGADMAKGGMAIVGTLVALNAVGAFARLLFTKKGILASISLFIYSMGGDITQMRSFYNATKEAFGRPLQEQFSKVSTSVLQKVLPEYEFLQTSMRTLGMSVYDYSLSPEETKITQGSLEFLQKKYKNSSDRDEQRFAEKAEEIQRILR